jgi:uncharacterized membrane protein
MPDTATLKTHIHQEIRRQEEEGPAPSNGVNVADRERVASAVGGGALLLYGLSRGNLGGLALALVGGAVLYRGVTGHCHTYQLFGINTAEHHPPATSVPSRHGVKVERSITIQRKPEELYRFWRNLENLPRFMTHLESVTNLGNLRSHWVARAPLGITVAWDAEIITEKENELIGWRSLPGSLVDNAGSVHFRRAPGGRGTEVKVSLKYDPPAGKVGATIARLFGAAPEQQIQDELRRLKQLMETGEIPRTEGQPRGRCS